MILDHFIHLLNNGIVSIEVSPLPREVYYVIKEEDNLRCMHLALLTFWTSWGQVQVGVFERAAMLFPVMALCFVVGIYPQFCLLVNKRDLLALVGPTVTRPV